MIVVYSEADCGLKRAWRVPSTSKSAVLEFAVGPTWAEACVSRFQNEFGNVETG